MLTSTILAVVLAACDVTSGRFFQVLQLILGHPSVIMVCPSSFVTTDTCPRTEPQNLQNPDGVFSPSDFQLLCSKFPGTPVKKSYSVHKNKYSSYKQDIRNSSLETAQSPRSGQFNNQARLLCL